MVLEAPAGYFLERGYLFSPPIFLIEDNNLVTHIIYLFANSHHHSVALFIIQVAKNPKFLGSAAKPPCCKYQVRAVYCDDSRSDFHDDVCWITWCVRMRRLWGMVGSSVSLCRFMMVYRRVCIALPRYDG